ncbi:MAG: ATP-dependent DNA helicase UvrD2 [Ilumatobacteraceae bacterium]
MAIACVYCGGRHETATEVRECWSRSQSGSRPPEGEPVQELTPAPPEPEPVPVPARSRRAHIARQMPVLGRNIVIRPGQSVPDGWGALVRQVVDLADVNSPAELVARLRRMADDRDACVFEIDDTVGAALAVPQTNASAIHDLGPRFTFEVSALHHLVWSNSVDGREPDHLSWQPTETAIALGATTAPESATGDVVLPDGTLVWLDGGPLRFTDPIDGVAVVHRIALEHGSLMAFESNQSNADLADDQLAAVTHHGGASRVIAPAGSGKTRVLTERARHLLTRWRLPASAVCLVAFNKRAQEEMSTRVADLRGLQVRTLNAIALAIVNGSAPFAAQPTNLTTISELDVRRIIGRLVEFPRKRNSDPVALWIEALSLARLGLRNPNEVEAVYDGDVDGFATMLPRYRHELAASRSLDFDEQIVRAIEILLTDTAARQAAQRACRVLLVDEFQDLTPAHLLLVRLLAGPEGCVFGVGDDDQTIYGFNGADPQWLIDFAKYFPHAGDHPLEVNYRCPADVVSAAATLLQHNVRRVPKTIRAASSSTGMTVEPPGDAVAATARIVGAAIADGLLASEVAVLTRVNSLLAPVQVALGLAGVATHGGVGAEFTDRAAVRGSLAWLRLATSHGALSRVDVGEALRNPSRPLRPNVAGWVAEQESVDGLRRLAARLNTPREAERVDAFAADIELLQQLAGSGASTSSLLTRLHDSMGMASTLSTLDTHRQGMNRAAQSDDLTAVAQLAELQPDPSMFESWLRSELRRTWHPDGVTLATVHRVKGKEWPIVIVHHAEMDQFPHRLATDVEEERRVFHVAITRGRLRVHVVPGQRPSPFIDQCLRPPDPAELARARVAPHQPVRQPVVAAVTPGRDLTPAESKLFEELRSVRRHLAAGKPAYTVLSDQSLHEIARRRPSTLAQLGNIKGMGPVKLERYGSALLAVVETTPAE